MENKNRVRSAALLLALSRPAASVPGCKLFTGSCAEVVMNAAAAELLGSVGMSPSRLLSTLCSRRETCYMHGGSDESCRRTVLVTLQLANEVRLLQCST